MLREKSSLCQDNQKTSYEIETNANELPVLSMESGTLMHFLVLKEAGNFLAPWTLCASQTALFFIELINYKKWTKLILTLRDEELYTLYFKYNIIFGR